MALSSFPLLSLLSLLSLLTALLHLASAAQWTVIEYNIEITTISTTTGVYTDYSYTETSTIRLRAPVSPTPTVSPTSSDTSTGTAFDVAYTTYYLPASGFPSASLSSLAATTSDIGAPYTLTNFYMDVVYTAPATCPNKFTFTTSTPLYVPLGAETNVSPTSLTTSSRNGNVYVTGYLPAGAATVTSTSAGFVESYYISRCSNPGSTTTAGGRTSTRTPFSGGDSSSNYGYDYYSSNCLGSLCPFWLIYIVIIVPLLVLNFLLGLIESYYWFTRLMKGQFALRGVPLFWVAISLWTLLCLRRHRSSSPPYQDQLLKQWREMSSGTHIKLWLKYGFRHRDPPQLAAIIGQQPAVPVWSSYPQPPPGQQGAPPMQQQPGGSMPPAPVYQQTPPWQGPQIWLPQQPGQPNGYSQPGSQPVSTYYPPPPTSTYSPPPGTGPTSPSPNGYMYPPPPQQQQPFDASRGSLAPTSSPSPAPGQPTSPAPDFAGGAGVGGIIGGVGGAAAAAPPGQERGGYEMGDGQGRQGHSPPTEQHLQPAPDVNVQPPQPSNPPSGQGAGGVGTAH